MTQAIVFAARLALFCALTTLLAACASPELPAPKRSPAQYLIQPNDLLLITFAGELDYNQQVRVDWKGFIDVPALAAVGPSEIRAAGLTPSALAERVTEFGRRNKILVAQRAQVFVTEFVGNSFVVLGQVTLPGRYFFQRGLPPQMELEEAIAMSGGYTRLARQSLVLVKRGNNVQRVNMRKLATTPGAGHFMVLPGDIITVTERIF